MKLMAAHTVSFYTPIRHMRQIVSTGELGRVIHVNYVNYSPWLLRPRLPAEVDTASGGGVCFRQAPHDIDIGIRKQFEGVPLASIAIDGEAVLSGFVRREG